MIANFADVSKAFDRVWIGVLLLKLERYGIKGDLLMWLKSYLTNRSQKVAIKEALSELYDLEKLKLEAARIVTGLTCYTSLDSIYREAGWEKLSTRREVKKLCMFYKLNVGNSPEFLCDLIPPSYHLRNSHNISPKSFFPSTTKLWNLLDLRIRQLSTSTN